MVPTLLLSPAAKVPARSAVEMLDGRGQDRWGYMLEDGLWRLGNDGGWGDVVCLCVCVGLVCGVAHFTDRRVLSLVDFSTRCQMMRWIVFRICVSGIE